MSFIHDLPKYESKPIGVNPTERALLAREVSLPLARRLRQDRWTLSSLQQEDDASLTALGLSRESIGLLRSSGRPGIPPSSLFQVLIANGFTCCVCHDPERPIIVHHIEPWAESHDHRPANLAVLCEIHHGQAHTRSDLTRNLDSEAIRRAKAAWEERVRSRDAQALRSASRTHSEAWWYFNHRRLFELATQLRVPLSHYLRHAVSAGLATPDGILKVRNNDLSWMYEGYEGNILYSYVRAVLNAVIERLSIRNISDHLDASVLVSLLSPGDFIFVQGAHQFSPRDERSEGVSQLTDGRRRANGVEVRFTFDRWEATSSSAHGYLCGRCCAGSLVRVVNISQVEERLRIRGSVLAIAAAFNGLQQREYGGPYPAGLL